MQIQVTAVASRALDLYDVLDCTSIAAHIKKLNFFSFFLVNLISVGLFIDKYFSKLWFYLSSTLTYLYLGSLDFFCFYFHLAYLDFLCFLSSSGFFGFPLFLF